MNVRMILLSMVFAVGAMVATAEEDMPAGMQFQQAYQRMQGAETARNEGRHKEAIELYRLALKDYLRLSKNYPDWQAGVTRYRMAYCQGQLQLLLDAAVRQARVSTPSLGGEPGASRVGPVTGADDAAMQGKTVPERAAILMASNRAVEAHKLLLEALRRDPDDARIRLFLGLVRCHQGKFLDAVYVLEPLVEEQQGSADALVALATAYAGLGRLDAAKDQLEAATRVAPESVEAHYNLAQLLLRSEPADFKGAERHYRLSLEAGGATDSEFEERLEEASKKAGVLARLKFW